ncbi:MAG: MFS transporter [Actinomycetota bacterium]|nr:MFS transporter [Actinomycetota bacterium]
MRRLLAFTCVVVFIDTLFYAAITPLLPELSERFELSKSAAGVLAAAYPAGTFVGALPGGWLAARAGARTTVLLGLGLLVGSNVAFAVGDSAIVLDVARFAQGVGGAASWAGALGWLIEAAPRTHRGTMIGTALSAAVAGALFGPVLGTAAAAVGKEVVFGGVATAGAGLMAWAARMRGVPSSGDARLRALLASLADRRVVAGIWLTTLPGVLIGTMSVLAPLRLDELGAGAGAIGAAFLLAAALEAAVNPLVGRLSDRYGRLVPAAASVAGGGLAMAVLPWPETALLFGIVVVLGAPLIGALYTPAMAILSDGAEALGVAQGFAFALINLAWATGQTTGAAGGARLAELAGDRAPYLLLAGVCAVTLGLLWRWVALHTIDPAAS